MAEQLSTKEKVHYTNRWCISIGIKNRDLDNHPAIDDAILLINYRDKLWIDLTKHEQGVWAAMWNRVYHKQYPLKGKHYRQLEEIAGHCNTRQQFRQQQINQIKQLRKHIQNEGVHMTANPPSGSNDLVVVR